MTAGTFIEKLTGIHRHDFNALVSTLRTGDYGFKLRDHFTCSVNSGSANGTSSTEKSERCLFLK